MRSQHKILSIIRVIGFDLSIKDAVDVQVARPFNIHEVIGWFYQTIVFYSN